MIAEECDWFVENAKPRMSRSSVVDTKTGGASIGGSKKKSASPEVSNKKKEAAEAKQRAREALEQENLGGIRVETVDFSVPSYSESTSQQQKSKFSL